MKKFSPADIQELQQFLAPGVQELSSLPPINEVPKNGVVIVTDPANPLSKVVYMNSGKYWIVLSSSSVIAPTSPSSPPIIPPAPSSSQVPRVFVTPVVTPSTLVTIPTPFPSPYSSYPYSVAAFLIGPNYGEFQVVQDPGDSNKTPTTINFPDIQFNGDLHVFAMLRN